MDRGSETLKDKEAAAGELPVRPLTLSDEYLQRALHEFQRAFIPPPAEIVRLFGYSQSSVAKIREKGGPRAQARSFRNATLFAAIAAESYVNEFLWAHAPDGDDRQALRWLRPIEKYVSGTYLVSGERLFRNSKDDEVMPTLNKLFEARNKLVHANPDFGVPASRAEEDRYAHYFQENQVAEYIVCVAGAADAFLRRSYSGTIPYLPSAIWRGRRVIREHPARVAPLSEEARELEEPLVFQALRYLMSRAPSKRS